MGDRVRIGEFLAAIGTVGLLIALAFTGWFRSDVRATAVQGNTAGRIQGHVSLDAGTIGWFAFAVLIIALFAGIVFIVRVLTGRGPERAMLQAPIAYAFAGFAFLTLLVRLFIFQPGMSNAEIMKTLPKDVRVLDATVDISLTRGAWIGLGSVTLLMLGTWFSMYDERNHSAAAKRRTAELLADVPVRPVPHVPSPPESEASVVADDAVGLDDDPTTPSSPASGGPA